MVLRFKCPLHDVFVIECYITFLCGCLVVRLGAHERSWSTCDGNYRAVCGPTEAQVMRQTTNRNIKGQKVSLETTDYIIIQIF